jgi:hypothetical protein
MCGLKVPVGDLVLEHIHAADHGTLLLVYALHHSLSVDTQNAAVQSYR